MLEKVSRLRREPVTTISSTGASAAAGELVSAAASTAVLSMVSSCALALRAKPNRAARTDQRKTEVFFTSAMGKGPLESTNCFHGFYATVRTSDGSGSLCGFRRAIHKKHPANDTKKALLPLMMRIQTAMSTKISSNGTKIQGVTCKKGAPVPQGVGRRQGRALM